MAEGQKLGPVEKITVFAKNPLGPVVIKVRVVVPQGLLVCVCVCVSVYVFSCTMVDVRVCILVECGTTVGMQM